ASPATHARTRCPAPTETYAPAPSCSPWAPSAPTTSSDKFRSAWTRLFELTDPDRRRSHQAPNAGSLHNCEHAASALSRGMGTIAELARSEIRNLSSSSSSSSSLRRRRQKELFFGEEESTCSFSMERAKRSGRGH